MKQRRKYSAIFLTLLLISTGLGIGAFFLEDKLLVVGASLPALSAMIGLSEEQTEPIVQLAAGGLAILASIYIQLLGRGLL